MDVEATEIECTADATVEPKEGESIQIVYVCSKSNLNEAEGYTSLRLNSSEYISGIPTDDDTLLNPVLTQESIDNKELKDCSKDSSVPPTFVFDSVDSSTCSTDGKFIIKGSLSEDKSIVAKFTIPLTYPEGTSIKCSYENNNMECIADKTLKEAFIIEQAIISDGPEELFIIKNVTSGTMNCQNGQFLEAEKKIDVSISFRQVSHIVKRSNQFNFFFAAFVNSNLPAAHKIQMNVIILVKEVKVEKVATCTLNEAVTTTGEPIQGDFDCVVNLETEEQDATVADLTVSANNDNIGGCSELTKEEASPKDTDDAISASNNAESILGVVYDYFLSENKNRKPPSLKINAVDLNRCSTKGKIKLTGTFSEDITEETTFELPFSFPPSNVKCTVEPVGKGQSTDITCKTQKVKKFGTFRSFVLEPKLIKKKKMEMFFIEKMTKDLGKDFTCESFNELKLMKAKERKAAPFRFLQMSRPPRIGNNLFFMALMKKRETQFRRLSFKVTIIIARHRLRALEETTELDNIDITCEPDVTEGNTGSFSCNGNSAEIPLKIDIDNDEIGGIPDDVPVETNPNPDYSQQENLKQVDSLIPVKIDEVTQEDCSTSGTYYIKATVSDSSKELDFEELIKVNIPFSNPDSSGLCDIKVKDKKSLEMTCENTEAFTPTEIIIPSQIVKDENDTPKFKIEEDYTVPTQFACTISDKSLKDPFPEETESTSKAQKIFSKSSGGLGGGAIAGIVISIVAVVAIVGIVALLAKKGTFGGNSARNDSQANSSTIYGLKDINKIANDV